MIPEKVCRWCGILKPAAAFSKWASHQSGLQCWCKVCVSAHKRGEPGEKKYFKDKYAEPPTPPRRSANEMPLQCPTCGCGYETKEEAEGCCPPLQVGKRLSRYDTSRASVILENRYRWHR